MKKNIQKSVTTACQFAAGVALLAASAPVSALAQPNLDMRELVLAEETVLPQLEGNPAADTIKQLITEIFDAPAAMERIREILKDADPGTFAAEFQTVENGRVVDVSRYGELPLTDLRQLSRKAMFDEGAVADTIKTIVTEIFDRVALERLQEEVSRLETERVLVLPLAKRAVDMKNLEIASREVLEQINNGEVADTIKTIVTEIWDAPAAMQRIQEILENTNPDAFGAQFIVVNGGVPVDSYELGGMPLDNLEQKYRTSFNSRGEVADTIKTIVTEIFDRGALLQLEEALRDLDGKRVDVRPLTFVEN